MVLIDYKGTRWRNLRPGSSRTCAPGDSPCPAPTASLPDDLAVNDKTFAYLSGKDGSFGLSCKLPYTGYEALQLPFAKPTAYGLGKSGWVSFTPPEDAIPSLEQLKAWVEESYRVQAPKRLVKELDETISG